MLKIMKKVRLNVMLFLGLVTAIDVATFPFRQSFNGEEALGVCLIICILCIKLLADNS